MDQIIQIGGSVLVLIAFGLAQLGMLDHKSRRYLLLNTVGSGVLAVDALFGAQWGFLLLEGVWSIISAISLVGVLLRGRPGSDADSGMTPGHDENAPSGEWEAGITPTR
ncbi:CBU_0592 family membrane protein [Arthrobacter dokdonensis]|uniref:CBU_0592 family membrane protein n=1 Tax=Arthrobacter dokdonellae TaxID=2211210 RepID=UPI001D132268|nr:hypothetical protein [Arthrobacter dokdonellae]